MSQTSTSDHIIHFKSRLFINKNHLCKLRHRKKLLENFRKFISQERHIRILIWRAYCLRQFVFIWTYSVSNFVIKIWFLRKSLLRLFVKITKDHLSKMSFIFFISFVAKLKISNPDSVWVKYKKDGFHVEHLFSGDRYLLVSRARRRGPDGKIRRVRKINTS